jgi:ABC-type Fe3+ transport system permease subunit
LTVDISSLGPALVFALGGAAISACLGVALGITIGALDAAGRRLSVGLAVVLLAAPPAFWWIGLTRLSPVFGRASGVLPAAVLAGVLLAPISMLLVLAAVQEIPTSAYEAARLSLGPARRFWRILVPSVRPALIAGFLLTGILLLGESEIPFLFGFRTSMTDVVTTFSQTFNAGRTVPIILPLLGVVLAFALATVSPLFQIVLSAATTGRGVVRKRGHWITTIGLFMLPAVGGLSLGGYVRAALAGDVDRHLSIDSASVAASVAEPVLCAFAALLLAIAFVYPLRRHVASRVIAVVGLLLFCVPTAVTAIGWIAVGQAVGHGFSPAAAHVSRTVGLAVLGFLTAYARVPRSHEQAADLVPLPAARRAWTLTLPALRPSLIAVAALIAAVVFADRDVASLLLAPGDSRLMLDLYLLSANAPSATVGAMALVVLAAGAATIALAAAGPAVLWWPRRE